MIASSDIASGVSGVLAMARAVPDWFERMDPTLERVFGSFWSFLLTMPLIALSMEGLRRLALAGYQSSELLALPAPVFIGVHTVVAYLTWGAAMVLLLTIVQRRGEGWRAAPVIMAQNWSSFIGYGVLAPLMALHTVIGGEGGISTAGLSILLVMAFTLWIDWGIVRRGVGVDPLPSSFIILALQAIAMLISDLSAAIAVAVFT